VETPIGSPLREGQASARSSPAPLHPALDPAYVASRALHTIKVQACVCEGREVFEGRKDNSHTHTHTHTQIKKDGAPLGLSIQGGADTSEPELGIRVRAMRDKCAVALDGRIAVGDEILMVCMCVCVCVCVCVCACVCVTLLLIQHMICR
jgi:hypothetical protein